MLAVIACSADAVSGDGGSGSGGQNPSETGMFDTAGPFSGTDSEGSGTSTSGGPGLEPGDAQSSGSSSTGSAECAIDYAYPEPTGDAICLPETSALERIEACICNLDPPLLDPTSRPVDAADLLYYVNRWYSIDPCFPTEPMPSLLEDVRAQYINQVDDLEPELETRCGTYEDDIVQVPPPFADGPDELRLIAWSSPAPNGYHTTLDGLDVGFVGAVGFGPMFAAAADEAGLELYIRSAFRSMSTQADLFEYYSDIEGDPAIAATYSAWPAHSEHQLGTTADVGYIEDGVLVNPFDPLEADLHWTEAFVWIRANAHRFGIVTTYQPTRVHLHQYKPEPWHLRFVGVEAADIMHACDLSTEEFLAYRYGRGALPEYPEIDLVYDAQVEGGWTPQTCAE